MWVVVVVNVIIIVVDAVVVFALDVVDAVPRLL